MTSQKANQILNFDQTLSAQEREQQGAFYTPLAIADDMVKQALRSYLQGQGITNVQTDQLLAKSLEHLAAQRCLALIAKLNWLDMAAGTGVFGLAYLEQLYPLALHYQRDEVAYMDRVMQNMCLNDINAAAIGQFKALVKARLGLTFSGHTLNDDALTQLPNNPNIQAIVKSGGFDIIIGNPPYLGERGNKTLFNQLKNDDKWSRYYNGKMDLFYFFIHQAINLIAKQGVISQITTSYFTTADGAAVLRNRLQSECQFLAIRHYHNLKAFNDISPLSFLAYTFAKRTDVLQNCQVQSAEGNYQLTQAQLYDDHGQIQLVAPRWRRLLANIKAQCPQKMSDYLAVNQGIVSGADRLSARTAKKDASLAGQSGPIFVFNANEYQGQQPLLKPFIKNSQVTAYGIKEMPSAKVLYSANDNILDYVQWLEHLKPYRRILEQRREVQNGCRQWYELQWPRRAAIFEGAKIIAPQRALTNCFAYVEKPLYGSADIYFLTAKGAPNQQLLKALTIYLNSPIVHFWLYYMGKRKGAMLELYRTPLLRIPVPVLTQALQTTLAKAYDDWQISHSLTPIHAAEAHLYSVLQLNGDDFERWRQLIL